MADNERTLGSIVKDLTEHISTLFRSEIELLKLEVKDTVAKLGSGVGLFAGAAALAIFGLAFLFVTLTLGLVALGVPAWVSSLIVTIILFIGAGVLAMMGKKKFAAVKAPTGAIDQMKSDVETIKADVARARSR